MSSQVIDLLVVGGGPAGLAASLRAKELGLVTLLLDVDDLMRRIRDYSKDKLILPSFGGGDRMPFPEGGEWLKRLAFEPIDKDDLCFRWKALIEQAGVPHKIGAELIALEDQADGTMLAKVYDHKERRDLAYITRHVALALGRGVPRRFDIPGDTASLRLRLEDPAEFLGEPVCVIGGGTSAAEAVIALSRAKSDARDPSVVHWSYRGDKLPRVSKALAETFFEAYTGNGNIRYHPHSEPMMITLDDQRQPHLAIRVDRRCLEGRAVETSLLEFPTGSCIACIGEDLPEAFLASIGITMATGGARNRKRMVVTRHLETQRRNVFLIGDILSQAHFETNDFTADPTGFKEVRHRGNIKAAMRDGVLVAQVIRQRLDGITDEALSVDVESAQPKAADADSVQAEGAASPATDISKKIAVQAVIAAKHREAAAWLIRIFASGAETEEFPIPRGAMISLGSEACDLSFPDDTLLSPRHASLISGEGGIVLRDDGSANGLFLQVPSQRKLTLETGDLLRAGRQFLLVHKGDQGFELVHYDASGQERNRFPVGGGPLILGRDTLDANDSTLSRRQLALTIEKRQLLIKDLLSANGTFLRVNDSVRLMPGDRFLAGQQCFAIANRPDDIVDPGVARRPMAASTSSKSSSGEPGSSPAPDAVPSSPAAAAPIVPGGPAVTFQPLGKTFAVQPNQTLLDVAEANGVPIVAECHAGICGSDPLRIVSGHDQLVGPPDAGETETLEDLCGLDAGPCRLACKARIKGPVVVEILDR